MNWVGFCRFPMCSLRFGFDDQLRLNRQCASGTLSVAGQSPDLNAAADVDWLDIRLPFVVVGFELQWQAGQR